MCVCVCDFATGFHVSQAGLKLDVSVIKEP